MQIRSIGEIVNFIYSDNYPQGFNFCSSVENILTSKNLNLSFIQYSGDVFAVLEVHELCLIS